MDRDDEVVAILERWLEARGLQPATERSWVVAQFRDARVVSPGGGTRSNQVYLVKGDRVVSFAPAFASIDEAYDGFDASVEVAEQVEGTPTPHEGEVIALDGRASRTWVALDRGAGLAAATRSEDSEEPTVHAAFGAGELRIIGLSPTRVGVSVVAGPMAREFHVAVVEVNDDSGSFFCLLALRATEDESLVAWQTVTTRSRNVRAALQSIVPVAELPMSLDRAIVEAVRSSTPLDRMAWIGAASTLPEDHAHRKSIVEGLKLD